MPDEIKPDLPAEEQMTPGEDSVVGQGVAEIDEAVEADNKDAAVETPAEDESGNASEADAEAAMLAMMEKNEKEDVGSEESGEDEFPDLSGVQVETPMANAAEFQQLSPTPTAEGEPGNIELLLDVKMPVAIELGRTEMPISELLTLGPGSVVELSKLAGEPVDLLVNHRVIAKGEVVVVDENFGVRITQLLSPEERLKSLARE
ncbi:MAG: flagellar motor switch protein FliN [FCB group bacterium]|nr:flagellar motor switch protein FliN [FCB group bacterium]